jgi:hypothetical protein
MEIHGIRPGLVVCLLLRGVARAEEFPKPYSPPCTERESTFEFTEKPAVKALGSDRHEIAFAVKGYCDVTVGLVDPEGRVVRHLGAGVLGANAPAPFQKNSLKQTIYWNGKDDLDAYVREPDKLRVRVSLGLKPVFDRLVGSSDPRNFPGRILGFAVDPDGVYVFSKARIVYLRKFDHDAKYVQSLVPPPASLPESGLGGRTSIEYEAGRRSHHGPFVMQDMGFNGNCVPGLDDDGITSLQPAVVRKRIYFCNGGSDFHRKSPSTLHYLQTDGSTTADGLGGRKFIAWESRHEQQRFAASPDGKWVYMVGLGGGQGNAPLVVRFAVDDNEPAQPFIGKAEGKGARRTFAPGNDGQSLNQPTGIDCDAAGRLYVADAYNHRVQIFSPDGQYLKTIPAPGVSLVQVHRKSGAIYVLHRGTVRGRSVGRLTKFPAFDKPEEEFHVDHVRASALALDSWTPRPRLWMNGCIRDIGDSERAPELNNVTVWEEDGKGLKPIADFDAEVSKSAGEEYTGRWSGSVFDHVNCDPVREQLYFRAFRDNPWVFDLKTGRRAGRTRMAGPVNDIAFDKRGYLHVHLDPGFYMPGVVRLDPAQRSPATDHLDGRVFRKYEDLTDLKEVPYDYGIELSAPQKRGWRGGLPVKDQPGAKYFQDGFGADMKGNLAVQSNIYYIPKMEEETLNAVFLGPKVRVARGGTWFRDSDPYQQYLRSIREKEKLGEEVYFIRRLPGIPLSGGTVWTFQASGERKQECAVIASKLVVGLQMDEDGFLYLGNDSARLFQGKPFLFQRGGNMGTNELISPYNRTPVTYTVLKTRPENVRWLMRKPAIPMDPPPQRPTDLVSFGPFGAPETDGGEMWVDGAEWLYAGLSPAVPAGCTCPATRFHLDWYKRCYVPEAYRRSIGILDTNGNLILHLGRYGTLDDALAMKPGTEDIALTLPRFVSGTDNYLAFDDWGERLVVLKLAYRQEEQAAIAAP